ncbi:MAG TPA: TerB family tellurite resistance protein [Chryseosolibacter sp.]|nr:TerB family tellurite resistance protein [Chryseosolibacter sp.]
MIDPVKLEHFRNLVSLSAADGKIEDVERVALSKIAYEHGIPLDRLNVMLQRADEYKYLIPQNHTDRDQQMRQMIEIAFVDGDFAPAELDLILMVGEKLGFQRVEIDAMLSLQAVRKD